MPPESSETPAGRRLPAMLVTLLFAGFTVLLLQQTNIAVQNSLRLFVPQLDWQRDLLALSLDRLAYALVVCGTGWLLFRRWFVGAMPTRREAPPPGDRWVGLLVGALVGALLFLGIAAIGPLLEFYELVPAPRRQSLGQALQNDTTTLVLHLLFTGCVTAALEEMFYRVSVQGFLHSHALPAWSAIVVTAALFALGHPGVMPLLFVVGLAFGFLFWRYGPGSATLAHALYNSLLLLAHHLFQE